MPKEEELKAADKAVSDAEAALATAEAALTAATESKDAAKISDAESKVAEAKQALQDAQAARIALDAEDPDTEDDDEDADDLIDDATGEKKKLSDGTDPNKKMRISRDKFNDLNEKAKLFGQFAPVLAKLQKDPKLVEKLMAGDDPNKTIEERMAALEARERSDRKVEITEVINAAVSAWPDFKKHWKSLKPLLAGLEAQGVPYADAVERAYFAVNPEAAKEAKRITGVNAARERENERGKMSPKGGGGGGAPRHSESDDEGDYQLNEEDLAFARATGLDPKLYAKHAEHIKKFEGL